MGGSFAARHRITINLEVREITGLSALSEKHRVSLAWLGRQAIIEFLERHVERHEKEGLQLPLDLSSEKHGANC